MLLLVCYGSFGSTLAARWSSDGGATWRVAPTCNVGTISGNGRVLAALYAIGGAALQNFLYTSVDGGATWSYSFVKPPINMAWRALASSTDGSTLVAIAADGGSLTGSVFIGSPSGSFAEMSSQPSPTGGGASGAFTAVAVSPDGARIVVAAENIQYSWLYVYAPTAASGGSTPVWTQHLAATTRRRFASLAWCPTAASATLVFAAGEGVWRADDAEVSTWTQVYARDTSTTPGVPTSSAFSAVGCSGGAVGSTVVLAGQNHIPPNAMFISRDGGATFDSLRTPASGGTSLLPGAYGPWYSAAVSADGSRFIALAVPPVGLYAFPKRWTSAPPQAPVNPAWTSVYSGDVGPGALSADISSDGSILFVCYSGAATISKDGGASWTASSALAGGGRYFCAMASNGLALVALDATNNQMQLSSDGGDTWTASSAAPSSAGSSWAAASLSSDGSVLAVADADLLLSTGTVFLSISGAPLAAMSDQPSGLPAEPRAIAVSPQGTRILLAAGAALFIYGPTASSPSSPVWAAVTGTGFGSLSLPFIDVAWCATADGSTLAFAAGEGIWRTAAADAGTWEQVLTPSWGSAGPNHTLSPQTLSSTAMSAVGCAASSTVGTELVLAGDSVAGGRAASAVWRSNARGDPGSWESLLSRAGDGLPLVPTSDGAPWASVGAAATGSRAFAISPTSGLYISPSSI